MADELGKADVGVRPDPAHRLIEATIAAIDAGGEVAVRVHDIAAEAGVQIPILYRHFGNREGLLQAAQVEVLRRSLARNLAEIKAAIESVDDAQAFRDLFDVVLRSLGQPERMLPRWRRMNVLGSTYGRPAFAAEVARLQGETIDMIAGLFDRPQREGWMRSDLDTRAFSAWFAGQTLGRILIELGETKVDAAAWDAISASAVRHVMFGV